MRYRIFALLGLFYLSLAGVSFGADQYAVDPAHTAVGFAVQHLVISTVKGSFPEVSGDIFYDEADVTKSSVKVTIQASSINTNNPDRDKHLKSADFLDATQYPTLVFQSAKVEKQGDSYLCVGNLTIHGVTKEVSIPFEIAGKVKDPWGKTSIGIEGSLTINRHDYGVSWNKTMDNGGVVVGDKVKISLNVEAVLKE